VSTARSDGQVLPSQPDKLERARRELAEGMTQGGPNSWARHWDSSSAQAGEGGGRMKYCYSKMAASRARLLLSAPVVRPSRLPSLRVPHARLRDRHPRRTTVARHLWSAP